MSQPDPARSTAPASYLARALLVAGPLLLALGFGHLHLQYRNVLRQQDFIATAGVPVAVNVDSVSMQKPAKPGEPEKCLAVFRYETPGARALVKRRVFMPNPDFCKRRKQNDNLRAWVVPGDDRRFMLEEERLPGWLSWATLFGFMIFGGFAIIAFRNILGVSRRKRN